MAAYFGNLVGGDEREKRIITPQPLSLVGRDVWFDDCSVNARRCVEAAHHMLQAGLLAEAQREMCNVQYVCAVVRVGASLGFDLVRKLTELQKIITSSSLLPSSSNKLVSDYARWVRKSMNILCLHRSTVAEQIVRSCLPRSSICGCDPVTCKCP
jgi:hypothetical protein